MRRLKIRTKVTLWYTGFLFLIVAAVLGILSYFSDSVLTGNQKQNLIDHVEEMADEWGKDEYEPFDDGIYFLVYTEDGTFEKGSMPNGFDVSTALQNGVVQTIGQNENGWYIYDRQRTDRT